VLTAATIEQLKVGLRGPLIQQGDADYAEARKAYNAMIDKYPRMIVRCADVADAISCVNFARENDVLLAVRGGGHSAAGLCLVDDGLVIDLSPMRGVRVDPQRARCGSREARPWAMWTTLPTPSAWLSLPVSSPPRASED